MENNLIKVEQVRNIFILKLDNPNKKNALDDELISELVKTLDYLNTNSQCRVVLLGSANDVFCSGGDIKAMLKKEDMFQGGSINLRNQYHFWYSRNVAPWSVLKNLSLRLLMVLVSEPEQTWLVCAI